MTSRGERWRLGRRPALDGLRGIAILLVMLYHAGIPGLGSGGTVGVTIFFTLSGFLITALLLEEHARTGRVRLGAFYLRRARRLLPALLVSTVAIALVALVAPWFASGAGVTATLLYAGNWVMATGGWLGGLGGTWSLAIEEQFYLAWPLLLIVAARFGPRAVGAVAGLGAAGSLVARWALWADGASWPRLAFGSDTRADALLVGCVLAVLMHSLPANGCSRPRVAAVACGVLVLLCAVADGPLASAALESLVPVLTAVVVFAVVRGSSNAGSGWLAWRPLTWVGRRSYGLYLWHCPLTVLLGIGADVSWPVHALVLLPVSFGLAVLSWRFVEEPLLRRRAAATVPPSPVGARPDPAAALL